MCRYFIKDIGKMFCKVEILGFTTKIGKVVNLEKSGTIIVSLKTWKIK